MQAIQLKVQSQVEHTSQIITGFSRLKEQGYPIEIVDEILSTDHSMGGLPAITAVSAGGERLVYDLWDGYGDLENMEKLLENCDLYFKRSFSAEKNALYFPQYKDKMMPLGFNYHVTCRDNPIREPAWKAMAKQMLGKTPQRYFVPEVFEGKPEPCVGRKPRILFLARLWNDQEPDFPERDNAERTYINHMRIDIIRALRKRYGDAFFGGLNDNALSRAWAPELIVPSKYTERRKYLRMLHSSDICIGSMGLFESIGWKTGEYIAAAKGIVNEQFHYSVPGEFREGIHYLSFASAQDCLDAVQRLVEDPEMLFAMKQANYDYYQSHLKPEILVKNSLELAEEKLGVKLF